MMSSFGDILREYLDCVEDDVHMVLLGDVRTHFLVNPLADVQHTQQRQETNTSGWFTIMFRRRVYFALNNT